MFYGIEYMDEWINNFSATVQCNIVATKILNSMLLCNEKVMKEWFIFLFDAQNSRDISGRTI